MARSPLRWMSRGAACVTLAALAGCGGRADVVTGEPAARVTTTLPGVGTTEASAAPGSTTPAEPALPDRSANILPSVKLTDVGTGGRLILADLVPA